jgi:ABC-type dipeptide/oligopeptide/nickel transport system permease component
MREKLGLDRPPFERYIEWLTSAVQGTSASHC